MIKTEIVDWLPIVTRANTSSKIKMADNPNEHQKNLVEAFDKINECLGGLYTTDAHRQAFLQFMVMATGIPIQRLPRFRTGQDEYAAMHDQAKEIRKGVMKKWSDGLWPRRDDSEENTKRLENELTTYIVNLLQCDYSIAPALQTLLEVATTKDPETAIDTPEWIFEQHVEQVTEAMENTTFRHGALLHPDELLDEIDDDDYEEITAEAREDELAAADQAEEFDDVVEHDNDSLASSYEHEARHHVCDCSVDAVGGKQIECGEEFANVEDLQDHREKEHGVEAKDGSERGESGSKP